MTNTTFWPSMLSFSLFGSFFFDLTSVRLKSVISIWSYICVYIITKKRSCLYASVMWINHLLPVFMRFLIRLMHDTHHHHLIESVLVCALSLHCILYRIILIITISHRLHRFVDTKISRFNMVGTKEWKFRVCNSGPDNMPRGWGRGYSDIYLYIRRLGSFFLVQYF